MQQTCMQRMPLELLRRARQLEQPLRWQPTPKLGEEKVGAVLHPLTSQHPMVMVVVVAVIAVVAAVVVVAVAVAVEVAGAVAVAATVATD